MAKINMPCQGQDILTLLALAAERLNDLDGADVQDISRALSKFADENIGVEAEFLKRVSYALTPYYGRVK